MERILDQQEIDELLSAFEEGQIDPVQDAAGKTPAGPAPGQGKQVSGIDLIRGQNYSRWRIANLDVVFNSFARYYSIALSNSLQQGVTVSKGEVTSRFFEDFIVQQEDAGLLGVFSLDPLKGNGLLVFDKRLCFGLVEVMLGMSGAQEYKIFDREVSAIEANLIRSLMSEGCAVFNRSFAPLEELNTGITRVETNRRLLSILAPETEVIQVTFSVRLGSLQGKVLMVIPYFSLEPFKDRLRDEGLQMLEEKEAPNWARQLESELRSIEISVSAVWGETYLTVEEILSMRKGDIISIDYDEAAPVRVLAGEKPKFSARPGVKNGKKVVRLVQQQFQGE
ncbi:MAG: FliM/FliN family flagellar motor switch protein [Desulfosalsimonas sp.]